MKFLIFITLICLIFAQTPLNKTTNVTKLFLDAVGLIGETFEFEVYTGYIPISNAPGSSIFYELATKTGETINTVSPSTPIVFWFQGGPGCSSQFGSWGELGPFEAYYNYTSGKVQTQITTRIKNWNQQAMLVFVDQPFNVGFSYSPNITISTTDQADDYFQSFIYGFYTRYSNFTKNPMYFFGESFAGHYIPHFALGLLRNNSLAINFTGIGIGDGWTTPSAQMLTFDSIYYVSGIMSSAARKYYIYQDELQSMQYYNEGNLIGASNEFDLMTNNTVPWGNVNIYNFMQYNNNSAPQDAYVSILTNKDFASNYGAATQYVTYQDCNNNVYNSFCADIARDYIQDVAAILNDFKINVMLYNGQLDLIVNSAGAQNWINQINSQIITNWQQQKKQVWRHGGTRHPLGTFKNYQKFTYVQVFGAGHMVPADRPAAAFDLFNRTLDWDWS